MDSMKNFVTGNAADINILFNEPKYDLNPPNTKEPFKVIITARCNADLQYNKVYLVVRSCEELDQFPVTSSENPWVTETQNVVRLELQADGPGQMNIGDELEWEVEVTLPPEAQPSFKGKYISNVWDMEAAIGTGLSGGRNPSSGRVNFVVES